MKKTPREIRLGKLELEIMKAVWDRGRATVAEVQQALPADRPRAYNTILTMMRKLEAKGYLAHDLDDRTFVYRAVISRERVRHSAIADLVDRVFDGSAQLLVSGLMDYKRLSAQEAAEIRKLLDSRGGQRKGKTPE